MILIERDNENPIKSIVCSSKPSERLIQKNGLDYEILGRIAEKKNRYISILLPTKKTAVFFQNWKVSTTLLFHFASLFLLCDSSTAEQLKSIMSKNGSDCVLTYWFQSVVNMITVDMFKMFCGLAHQTCRNLLDCCRSNLHNQKIYQNFKFNNSQTERPFYQKW